jgi:hypothetical protein
MVENWDEMRKSLPDGRAVMLTDASNLERDQMNAMAQERRAAAGELGAHRVKLPGKPYGLAAGDEVIFSAQYRIPGQNRIENGITGTIIDTSREQDNVTIKTHEREHARYASTPARSLTCLSPMPRTSTKDRASRPRPPASSSVAGRPTRSTPT